MLVQYRGMKSRLSTAIIFLAVMLAACDNGPMPSSYRPVLPALPLAWKEIPGAPHWRLEWIDEGGSWRKADISPDAGTPGLSLPLEWTTPVLAWPYWPALGLFPEVMRPAGGLFPWDSSGDRLELSWKGGVDAVFWKELAAAERETDAAGKRIPWFFDWPRFRELMESENIPGSIREDPWLADWEELGSKTVQSGFDRRRIKPMKTRVIEIPGLEGRWAGSSPFAAPVEAPPGGPLRLEVTDAASAWVSAAGVLKCSSLGFVFIAR